MRHDSSLRSFARRFGILIYLNIGILNRILFIFFDSACEFALTTFTDESPYYPGCYDWNNVIDDLINTTFIPMKKQPELAQSEKIRDYFYSLLKRDNRWLYSKSHVIYLFFHSEG